MAGNTKSGRATKGAPSLVLEDDHGVTGGFISSLSQLEKAQALEPHIIELVKYTEQLECVPPEVKARLQALIAKHS